MAYYQLEPFGEERDDLRSGIIASTIANANRGKGQKPFKPSDFMPSVQEEKPKLSAAQRLRAALAHRVVKKT